MRTMMIVAAREAAVKAAAGTAFRRVIPKRHVVVAVHRVHRGTIMTTMFAHRAVGGVAAGLGILKVMPKRHANAGRAMIEVVPVRDPAADMMTMTTAVADPAHVQAAARMTKIIAVVAPVPVAKAMAAGSAIPAVTPKRHAAAGGTATSIRRL
jgi:hypothetical protein